jgi:bidirectional [NiFe] hydrogenase diaphorase subunit
VNHSAPSAQNPAQSPASNQPASSELSPAQQKAQERIAAARAKAAAAKASVESVSATAAPVAPAPASAASISAAERAVGGSARALPVATAPHASPTVAPPTDDKRWRVVFATMRKHGFAANSLIETLHTAQESFGFLSDPALIYIARSLHLPPARVYGVATFYNLFHLQPQGEHSCVICLGTACYIKGAAQIVAALEDATGISVGATTPDGQISLLAARCLGACGLAPACVFDGEVVGKLESRAAVERLGLWTEPSHTPARSVAHATG